MQYEELDVWGKIWYFILFFPVIIFILLLTLLVASFALLMKLAKVSRFLDAFSTWAKVIGDGFTKRVKNAGTRKEN